MRIQPLIALALLVLFRSFTYGQDVKSTVAPQRAEHVMGWNERVAIADKDVLDFDIVQRTCAMYVAVRSKALEGPVAFGRDLEDVPVHWNMCPGGTMVACATTPTAEGDTVRTGIPWPY